jgi:tRNA threonylcarbamoyladenosine biosynthesis protein TsaB
MTTLLAFDTTAGACSVAVRRDGATVAHRSVAMARGHAEALIPMVVDTLAAAGFGFGELAAVAATTGPGAFTGIRIGLAAARGIALAAGIPAIGIGALDAVAAGVDPARAGGRHILAAIDTKRGDFYAQLWSGPLAPAGVPAALDAAALAAQVGATPVLVTGDAAAPAHAALTAAGADAVIDPDAGPPDAAVVARLAARLLETAGPDLPPATPTYLRSPEARLPGDRRPPAP